ncbi:hypothetical protein H0H81_000265 [Sphagnurus paluster]|uniref:Uncharacterized protein n=1 Tax=Sphagnurus paluster TaxID=117069 RepID=A0A9P7GGJ0_9AGAR|nr:hypothetical protein H0H81_000265 [Sphagnurus paluster]
MPLSGDMTPHSVMFGVEEKKMQVSGDSKLDTKRRWRWRRRNTEFIPSASPIAVRTTGSLGIHSKKSQSVRLPSSPLWDPPTRPQPATLASFPQHAEGTQLGLVATAESINSAELQAREKPRRQHFHSQSTDKLTRTLGIPSNATNVADTQTQAFDTDTSFKNEDTTKETPKLSRSRRMSLSLSTTLNSLPCLLRSPAQSPKQSRVSLSTLNTDDVHQFGLADDLSDSWGAIRDGSGTSLHSTHSPISPITFKPPTPVAAVPPGRPSAPNLPAGDKVKPDAVTSSSQRTDAALGRSRSLSFVPARIGRLVQLASANAAAQSSSAMPQEEASPSAQQDIPDEAESGLPVKANWLTSPGEEEAKARSFVVRHPEYADEYKSWSGQWNQDPQHVIKMLRSLK